MTFNSSSQHTLRRTLPIPALARGLIACASTWAQSKPAEDSVYPAWGGKDGIRGVMEDFVVRLQADARTGPFFKNASRERLVTQLTAPLCQESGGPCSCQGAPMGPVHASMNVGKGDFNALVAVLQQNLDAKGIPFPAQNGMRARLAPLHREIVTRN